MRTTASPIVDGGAIYAALETLVPKIIAPIQAIIKISRFQTIQALVVKDIIYLTFCITY